MIKTIIIVLAIVFLLTIVMFIFLKRIVNSINEQTKLYFLMKLQSYDDLIEEKEKKLEEVSKEIENINISEEEDKEDKEITKSVIVSNESPDYEIEDFVERLKEIENNFNFDNNKVINCFIDLSKKNNSFYYNELISTKKNIEQYGIYNIITKQESEENKIYDQLKLKELKSYNKFIKENNTFNIVKYMDFLDIEIRREDPTIYIYVGNKNINYDNLSANIKTVFDEKIIKGIKIKYHSIIYDYSLS